MLLQISLSAEEYAKGDRVAYKAKKDEWYAGTVSSVRAGLVGILFDDGLKASPSKPSSRTWRRLKGVKKFKNAMTDAQVEAVTLVAEKAAKAKAPTKTQPKAKVEPVVKKVSAAKPATPAVKTFIGSVVRSRFGDIAILSSRIGRKYEEFKWSTVSGKPLTGWIKLPMHMGNEYAFSKYPFVRPATKEEMAGGMQEVQKLGELKAQRKSDAFDKIQSQSIKPGDVVQVKYSDGTKSEAVLEVDYKAAKLAIVRQQSGAAAFYSKRRLIPVSICTKIADGGGKFDPHNPIYKENGIYIPNFYKEGNTVAPRRQKPSWGY